MAELKRRAKVVQVFPSTDSVMRLLGDITDEIDAEWASGNLFMSKSSLKPVLELERIEDHSDELIVDKEVKDRAKVIMMVALDEYAKAS